MTLVFYCIHPASTPIPPHTHTQNYDSTRHAHTHTRQTQAGASVVPGDSIGFTLDTFLLLAPDLVNRLYDTVKRGKTI